MGAERRRLALREGARLDGAPDAGDVLVALRLAVLLDADQLVQLLEALVPAQREDVDEDGVHPLEPHLVAALPRPDRVGEVLT